MDLFHIFNSFFNRKKRKLLRQSIAACGDNVRIPHDIKLHGHKLHIGNNVYLGEDSLFMCANAPITIGNNVIFGPRVTMISGDHCIDIKGKYMIDVQENEKKPENDQPIILKGDNWISANVTILKDVTIGEGTVVAAGSVVTRDLPNSSVSREQQGS